MDIKRTPSVSDIVYNRYYIPKLREAKWKKMPGKKKKTPHFLSTPVPTLKLNQVKKHAISNALTHPR